MAVYPFQPDYAVPPGSTLRELLEERGMSQSELAARTELSEKTISQIVNGTATITIETAAKLEMATGVPASFWNARETHYRSSLLRRQEKTKLSKLFEWLKQIPVAELISRGLIAATEDKGQLVHEVLKFFGVTSIEAWDEVWLKPQLQFRGSKARDNHPGYVAAWVRIGEMAAANMECGVYNAKEFRGVVQEIRALTPFHSSESIPRAIALCARCGVALVLVKEIPNASVSGAAMHLTNRAVIMLSLKYRTDDQFWFSFFHEAGHVLLHRRMQVFVDDGMSDESEEERDANKYARDLLIPTYYNSQLPHLKSKAEIRRFAATIGVSPGIVVGRLQHEGFIPRSYHNDLKVRYKWA